MNQPAPPSSGDDVAGRGRTATGAASVPVPSADASESAADAAGESAGDRPAPRSYEAARTELAEVMRALESGGQSLEESLELWKRGEELADLCQRWLDAASARLDEAIAARDDHEDRSGERRGRPPS